MSTSSVSCPFCRKNAKYSGMADRKPNYAFDCDICGCYLISRQLYEKIRSNQLDASLINCIAENVATNTEHTSIHWVSRQHSSSPSDTENTIVKCFEDYAQLPINHATKPRELLNLVASKTQMHRPFWGVNLTQRDLYRLRILDTDELFKWTETLKPLVETIIPPYESQLESVTFKITTKGWEEVARLQQSFNSHKVFVAMKFNWAKSPEKEQEFLEAIKLGCKDCGFDADIVSQDHTGYIMDRVISEIKQSRFIVADFTFNSNGAYFEAGLARGLEIPVIHTVMEGHTENLHFDVQQINYIKWSDPGQLRQQLRDRIIAVIER